MQNLAVIDLGTNTFHLLIVAIETDQTFREIYRERKYVKLAEEGIERIGEAPFQRGLDTLEHFSQIIRQNQVSQVRAFGTAALRTAQNGSHFIERVKELIDLDIQLIPGDEEARLIHKGVAQAVPFSQETSLIMDIGGGSVEFILADADQVYWAQSFPIGVAVLYREWQNTDPIDDANIEKINTFLDSILAPLQVILKKYPSATLVGASGTFDVLEQFLVAPPPGTINSQINVTQYHPFSASLKQKSLEERQQMPQLPNERADMIVVALILIDYIIHLTGIQTIMISAYAMKEGMLKEMIDDNF